MTHPNKRKGTAAENAVVRWLRDHGWIHAERVRAGWTNDHGNIDGLPGVTIEVKNEQRIDLAGYMGELEVEMDNGNCDTGVVVVKRRGQSDVGEWYAVMPVRLWAQLIRESGR